MIRLFDFFHYAISGAAMFLRAASRVVAAVVALSMLIGCAEIDRRGGTVAEIEDYVLFAAHTKSHRLFRSYLLIGVLLAAARQGGHNEADVAAIEGNLKSALAVAFEAYECLYQDPAGAPPNWLKIATQVDTASAIGTFEAVNFANPTICQFFDEKMARLDYALYRLALSSLFNEKTSVQLASIRDKLIGEVPVLSASAKAAIFGVRAINQTTTIVDDLLNLSFSSLGPVLTLLPLYRDSLEMNMWIIADTLTRTCADPNPLPRDTMLLKDGTPAPSFALDCQTKAYAFYILNYGNGDLRAWRNFAFQMNYVGMGIEAYAPHFVLVSRLIWRSCSNLLKQADCTDVLTKAIAQASGESILVKVHEGNRVYSASVGTRSRYARRPAAPTETSGSPKAIAAPQREPESTGSVGQPNAAGGVAPAR
ncbi:MAG: hypothetical protein ACK463_22215 [Bradyrhizobium sp.]|nr:hypothetical protein [Bradyrhizobium sp.]HAQ82378.1 hypothetical protein [Bradyrhizobium sp.]